MHAPMQPSSFPRGLQAPSSFGARRSISHDLARFSLDLAPERRPPQKVPYPSPPMSHSPPPPMNPQPNDQRHQAPAYYPPNAGQHQLSYGSYRYPQEQQQQSPQKQQQLQQPTPFSTNTSSPGEPESFPTPFPSISSGEHFGPPVVPPSGRSPFVPQTSFPPPPPPRRPKSHVASACVNCKKAHLACDTRRPCPRCVGLGKQETCVDVQHKKRGRPRLRDDHRAHSFEVGQMQRGGGIYSLPSSPSSIPNSSRTGPHRILKSQPFYRRQSLQEDVLGHASNYTDQRTPQRISRISLPPISNATAYLTTEMVVAKSTESMRELLGYTIGELDRQRSLFDIILETDRAKVDHLVNNIRDEMREREHKPWLASAQLFEIIETVSDAQIPAAINGARSHNETLHLRRPDGNHIRIRIRATLASTSVYFVVMVFSLVNEMPPPLQLSHSASYTNLSTLRTRTPVAATTPSLHSPSFSHHLQTQAGPQSPYSHPGMSLTSPMSDSRPRSMQQEYPVLTQYTNPVQSPANMTLYRPPSSPATMAPSGQSFCAPAPQPPGLQQGSLHLPPLQLKTLPDYGALGSRMRSAVATPEGPGRMETPRRERIGVREMLE